MTGNKNPLNAFEQQLKDSLEQYEVPFNSADWNQMDRALSSGVQGWGKGHTFMIGLLVAAGLLIGSTAYFLGRDSGSQQAHVEALEHQGQGMTGTDQSSVQDEMLPGELHRNADPSGTTATTTPDGPSAQAHHGTLTAQGVGDSKLDRDHTGMPHATSLSTTPGGDGPSTAGMPGIPPTAEAGSAPAKGFRASVKEACPGSSVDFLVEGMPDDGIYLWNFGDGSFSNKTNPQHVFTKPGLYQVTLSISNTGGGTIMSKPHSDRIAIHEAPQAAFNIVNLTPPGQIPAVRFVDRAQGTKRYHWDFGDGTTSTDPEPSHVYREAGVYQVVQTVENGVGCIDRQVKEVRIEHGFNLDAPKQFNPAGTGKNAYFMPQGLLGINTPFQLNIYDPTGNLVYATRNANHPWLGKLDNKGPVLSAGNYVWVADVDMAHGTENFTGSIELVK